MNERRIILLLCVVAAIRIFVFSAAFPFFNIVDEHEHFDLVVRYSQGDIPRAIAPPVAEAIPYLTLFSSPEYLENPAAQPGGHMPAPIWKEVPDDAKRDMQGMENIWRRLKKNHEATQPPLYYSLAGVWWQLGKLLKLDGGSLLCWLRCFNIFLVMVMIWLGWRTARYVFPENIFIQLAVPALVAFLPQTAFYSINNDILAPVTFGVVFWLLLKLWGAEAISPASAAALGLAVAAAYLSKTSNLPLLAVAGIFFAVKLQQLVKARKLKQSLPALLALALCAGLPMIGWMAWCKINFGDFTGSHAKIQYLGWTDKPPATWLQHPFFTLHGFWFFVKGNLSTFWQGEFLWWQKPLAIPGLNIFYTGLTLIVGLTLLIPLWQKPSIFTARQQMAMRFGFASIAAAFTFFAWLSVSFDFQNCFYPSQASPFFVSGRLMLGLLIPFMLLFAAGIDRLLQSFQVTTKFLLLAGFLAFMLASEIRVDWPVFASEYNWFHM